MRITKGMLKGIIRQVILEFADLDRPDELDVKKDNFRNSFSDPEVKEGDTVMVLDVEKPYSGDKMSWAGCTGIVKSVTYDPSSKSGGGVCTIVDHSGQLSPLVNCPISEEYIEVISSAEPGLVESVLKRVIAENVGMGYEDLKSRIRNIIEDLRRTLETCDSRSRLREINMAISHMSDFWNDAGGSAVGFFVDECVIGQMMNEIQMNCYRNPMLDIEESLSKVERELELYDFSELSI